MLISLFEVTFFVTLFGTILGPIFLVFSGPTIPIFFSFFKKKRLRRNPPKCIFLQFLTNAVRTPKMSQKGPQNAFKMVPKQSPKGLEKLHFLSLIHI